jgi:hypothetical protein
LFDGILSLLGLLLKLLGRYYELRADALGSAQVISFSSFQATPTAGSRSELQRYSARTVNITWRPKKERTQKRLEPAHLNPLLLVHTGQSVQSWLGTWFNRHLTMLVSKEGKTVDSTHVNPVLHTFCVPYNAYSYSRGALRTDKYGRFAKRFVFIVAQVRRPAWVGA